MSHLHTIKNYWNSLPLSSAWLRASAKAGRCEGKPRWEDAGGWQAWEEDTYRNNGQQKALVTETWWVYSLLPQRLSWTAVNPTWLHSRTRWGAFHCLSTPFTSFTLPKPDSYQMKPGEETGSTEAQHPLSSWHINPYKKHRYFFLGQVQLSYTMNYIFFAW